MEGANTKIKYPLIKYIYIFKSPYVDFTMLNLKQMKLFLIHIKIFITIEMICACLYFIIAQIKIKSPQPSNTNYLLINCDCF